MEASSSPIVPRENFVPFMLLVSCFALWGLVNAMAEALVPAFGKVFSVTNQGSALALVSHYGAYAVLAIPAALIVKKYSYKAGVLLGLGVFFIGVLGYIPAAMGQSYDIFLTSIFIYASGCSILETSCNPYVISMGSQETAVRRLNFAQAFNPMGCLIGLLVGKFVIFGNFHPSTREQRLTMSPEELKPILSSDLFWLVTPYIVLAAVALIIWLCIFVRRMPEGSDTEHSPHFLQSVKRLLSLPRYYWGVITQFFYVGLQTMVWAFVVKYAMETVHCKEEQGMTYYIYSMVCFIVARVVCTALMKRFNPAHMMALLAVVGIVLCLGAIYLPGYAGLYCLIAISACLSLMFPTIYGIALRGLGPEVKLGAAGLIMAILGGALVPMVFAFNLDHGTLKALTFGLFSETESIVRSSFYIPLACLFIVLAYSLKFRHAHLESDAGK